MQPLHDQDYATVELRKPRRKMPSGISASRQAVAKLALLHQAEAADVSAPKVVPIDGKTGNEK
jgi:hypothetical protein